jgi:hypothetical protein
MKAYGGSGCIYSRFLYMGTSWRLVVSFTPLPLYLRYPLTRRLGGPQSRYGPYGEVKILYPTRTRTPNPPSSSPKQVAVPNTLPGNKQTNKQTPWPESASELYRPSDSRLPAKLVPTFADRGESLGQCGESTTAVNLVSRPDLNRTLAQSTSLEHLHKALH